MGQASTSRNITTRRAGAAVDYQALDNADIVTGRNELAAAIFPGVFVAQGATDDDFMLNDTGAAGATYIGVATDNENRERVQGSTATTGYIQNALVPVARTGRFYVNCEQAATKGAQVYVRYVAGAGGTNIGYARTDIDTASAEAVNATFAETITAAGLIAVELNMPQV